jgi:membrane protease subunit HflK
MNGSSGRRSRGEFSPEDIPWGQIFRALPFVLVALLAVYLVSQSAYTVEAHEEAVVMRFGKYHATVGPGLHLKVPFVDEAVIVDVAEHSLRLPYGLDVTGRLADLDMSRAREEEPLILTGDLYAAVVEWNVIWRVAEPDKFLFTIGPGQARRVITAVARSVMHRVVGDYSADEVLTGKREEIGKLAEEEMQKVLNAFNSGIQIMALQMQRVTPPDRVKPAFDEVNAALQERDQLINEAERERNKLIPAAQAEADKLVRAAEGYAQRRVAEAQGEIAALLAKYEAYRQAPELTMQRLYLEMLEEVLANSGPKVIVDEELKSLLPLLQLELEGESAQGQRPEPARRQRPAARRTWQSDIGLGR